MSLINQMLQDLDARSADGMATSAIHDQVRPVAERRKVPVAWWLALALALVLLVVMAAWLLRQSTVPSASVPASPPASSPASSLASPLASPPVPASVGLSLKVAPDLAEVPLPRQMADRRTAVAPQSNMHSFAEAKPTDAIVAAPVPLREATPVSAPVPAPAPTRPSAMPKVPAAAIPPPAIPAKAPPPVATTKTSEPPPAVINKQVKEANPQQRAEAEYRHATTLLQQGRVTETMDVLDQVLQHDPRHHAARQTLVGLLLENKRQDEAMGKIQDGLRLDPNQPGLAMVLARRQVEKGELQPAVDTLQKTLPHAQERADYLAFLAALLQRQGNHKDAIEQYVSALRRAPQNGVWWMGLGISLQAESRAGEAQDAFGRAIASNTLSPELQAFVEQKLNQLQR